MAIVLHLAPPTGILTWNESDRDAFVQTATDPLRLGSDNYVAQAHSLIAGHLERLGEPTRFPTLYHRDGHAVVGWELAHLPALRAELQTIRDELAQISVSRDTLFLASEAEWSEFQRQSAARSRPLPTTIAEHLAPYLRNFEAAVDRAITEGKGLLMSF